MGDMLATLSPTPHQTEVVFVFPNRTPSDINFCLATTNTVYLSQVYPKFSNGRWF
jgi:hypothetical protein